MNFFKKTPDYKPNTNDVQTPIVTINAQGQILYSNTAAKRLFDRTDMTERNITDLIKSDLPSIITGSGNSVRKAFQMSSQGERYVLISSKENQDEHYFIITFEEVTKDYVLMNKLIEYRTNMDNLGRNKNLFLAQMSNVFKSPMHSIMGYSQAILEGMGGEADEKQLKYLSIIYKNSTELYSLIDKVTELSKIEAQLLDFSYKNYDINNLLNPLYADFQPKAAEKGLQLIISTDFLTQKVIYGDMDILNIIIRHLLENALLTCEFGAINIILSDKEYVEQGKNMLKITVADTSIPIKQSEMPYLFNPYYQPDQKSRIMLIKSLNLYIAGNLTSQLNGKMSAESDVSGFSIVIPTDKKIETSKVD
ncbi:MAG: PAS domain-containing sensor histidine kinase [Candidatus Gastranaerophilales bacterium]|nr:PAS domain-containing sensor histidine kinase [Candidatus Gastranaerophilales bacterium]